MRVGVDVGGTFTDVVLFDEEQDVARTLKVPTTPHQPQRAVCDALRTVLDGEAPVSWLGHATTIATNALLGQIGLELPRVALVTTQGFRDVIEIARQNRPAVYDLFVERPRPLVSRDDRFTVRERMDHRGNVVEPLDDAALGPICDAIREREIAAVAVCFLHAHANDAHERRVAERIAAACKVYVVQSAAVDPEYREYERFSTAVVTAALAPIVSAYLAQLESGIRDLGVEAPLYVMRSDGGLSDARAAAARPAALIESGPASGVIAAAALARELGIARALSFDMGGTTAKAGCILDGVPEIVNEYEAAGATHSGRAVKGSGYPVRYPFVDLSEVSAGGGTIAWIDDAGSLRLGPLSAGADPGPACYGRSDRATVTDANVALGRLPQTHLLGGAFPIDARRSRDAVAALASQLGLGTEETAAGIVRIVDAQMAKALRIVTIERGLDARDFSLVAFGGNGPLHACELAAELGITRILVPREAGMFSAQGLLEAELSATALHPVLRTTSDVTANDLEALFASLERRGSDELLDQGADVRAIRFRRAYDARYRGQSFELTVDHASEPQEIALRFHALHRTRYGYAVEDEAIELVNARSTATAARAAATRPRAPTGAGGAERDAGTRRVWIDGRFDTIAVLARSGLATGKIIEGPAIVEQYDCTTYVARGWKARVLADGTLSLEAQSA